jgi:hypothetical protein
MSHLPDSRASTLVIPPPGATDIVTPGISFWMASADGSAKWNPRTTRRACHHLQIYLRLTKGQRWKNKADNYTDYQTNLFFKFHFNSSRLLKRSPLSSKIE